MANTIGNFYKFDRLLSSGAQPTADDLAQLKDDGLDVIVNISPASAKNALSGEAAIVESLKMDYVHFPVDCSNLRPLHYQVFKGIMNSVSGKNVFVHCGGNIKSSNLIHMYRTLECGVDEAESLATLKKIQTPEDKWFAYFKTMGMQGIK